MVRVTSGRYRDALDLIGRARDCEDWDVVRACALVLRNYIAGQRVPHATIELISAFLDD